MDVLRVELKNKYWDELIKYANKCSWIVGKHLSNMLINNVYMPSDMERFYEKYCFTKIDTLMNYSGEIDNIFIKGI